MFMSCLCLCLYYSIFFITCQVVFEIFIFLTISHRHSRHRHHCRNFLHIQMVRHSYKSFQLFPHFQIQKDIPYQELVHTDHKEV